MVAPAHVNTTNSTNGSRVTNVPTGTGGILVLVAIMYEDGNPTTVVEGSASPPAGGWTLQSFATDPGANGSNSHSWVWTKADAGESGTFTWTGLASEWANAMCSRYTHASGTPIVDDVGTPNMGEAGSGNVPAVTTTVDECTIVAIRIGNVVAVPAAPSGYTQRHNFDTGQYLWDAPAAIAGTHGPTTVTFNSTDSYNLHAIALGLPPTAPPAPTITAADGGHERVGLEWVTGGTGGSPITDWDIDAATAAAPTTWLGVQATGSTNTSGAYTGLTNGTAYVFRVRAVNAIGDGTWSSTSGSVTPVDDRGGYLLESADGYLLESGDGYLLEAGAGVSGPNEGTASGSVAWVGVATGLTDREGAATGSVAWSGTAAGTSVHSGAATGSVTWAGAATGVSVHRGAATGSIAWAGSATSITTRAGAATGAVAWAGTATGTTTRSGSSSGTVTWAGTATGVSVHRGAATGAVAWVGSATGEAPAVGTQEGSASGTITWAGTATGTASHNGSAGGAISWAGAATGTTVRRGAGVGTVAWVGTATGESPAVGVNDGSAAGSITWIGTATGMAAHYATAAGTITWTGTAAAVAAYEGAALGSLTWVGEATGRSAPLGAPSISRRWTVQADDRTLAVIHDRTIRLPAATARRSIAVDDRTTTLPADQRRTIGATP